MIGPDKQEVVEACRIPVNEEAWGEMPRPIGLSFDDQSAGWLNVGVGGWWMVVGGGWLIDG